MILNTYFPVIHPLSIKIVDLSKIGLTVTLFLIGAGLSARVLRSVGIKPLLQGIILWIAISVAALWAIMNFVS